MQTSVRNVNAVFLKKNQSKTSMEEYYVHNKES